MHSAQIHSSQYLKPLDGLRGIAIIIVMFFHFCVGSTYEISILNNIASFGSSGVDLFFVISGFLITGILIDTKKSKFYFSNFYKKRLLRIFPLYYTFIMMYVLLIPGFIGFSHIKFADSWTIGHIHANLLSICSYLYNWILLFNVGEKRFLHLWSLAVEEQFYLIWPIFVFWVSNKRLLVICLIIFIIAILSRLFLFNLGYNSSIIYINTITRADSLAAGSIVSILFREAHNKLLINRIAQSLVVLGIIWVLINFLRYGGYWWFQPNSQLLGYSILALFFSAIIYLVIQNLISPKYNSRVIKTVSNLLESKILTTFGKYAYALYLFHELIRDVIMYSVNKTFVNNLLNGNIYIKQLIVLTLGFIFSLFFAKTSWMMIEKPILSLRRYIIKTSN